MVAHWLYALTIARLLKVLIILTFYRKCRFYYFFDVSVASVSYRDLYLQYANECEVIRVLIYYIQKHADGDKSHFINIRIIIWFLQAILANIVTKSDNSYSQMPKEKNVKY